jgi:hypothetical protein
MIPKSMSSTPIEDVQRFPPARSLGTVVFVWVDARRALKTRRSFTRGMRRGLFGSIDVMAAPRFP